MDLDAGVIILFSLVILITHYMEGITGFGCTVMALPFVVLLLGINTAVPVLIVLGLLLSIYIVIIAFKDIDFKEFLRVIKIGILGLPIGILFFSYMDKRILIFFLGSFMILTAVYELYLIFLKNGRKINLSNRVLHILLFAGGIIHGAYSTGGPLITIYCNRKLKDKSVFRATLSMVWLILNSILLVQNIFRGNMTSEIWTVILYGIPAGAVGAYFGNITHNKINQRNFSIIVYIILFISAIFMFLSI